MTEATTNRFSDLVRAHHAAVYRAALRVTQNVDDAADAAQQTFLVALEQGERLLGAEHPERVLKWLAVKQALMILRGERRRRERESATAMTPDARRSEDSAEQHEQERLTRAALRELPSEVRLAIELRFGEDMTFKEVAQAQDIAEPTAYERVQRGLESLRARLRTSAGAILAVDVETLVRDTTRLPPATIPRGLEGKLLALSAKSAGSTLALLPLLVTSAIVLTALIVAPHLLRDDPKPVAVVASTTTGTEHPPSPSDEPVRAPTVAQEPARAADPPPPTTSIVPMPPSPPAAISTAATAILRGRVVHADGRQLAYLSVSASSVVRDGKSSRGGAITRVRDDGTFDLAVEVAGEPDEDFDVFVEYETALVFKAPAIRLKPGEDRTLDPFVVALDIPQKACDWTIDATLVAPDRAIPDGTWVSVWRCVPTLYGPDNDVAIRETASQTTDGGHVKLKGNWVCKTRLEFELIGETLDRYATEFVVPDCGAMQRTFEFAAPAHWVDSQTDDDMKGFSPPPAEGTGTVVAHVRDPAGTPLLRVYHDVDALPIGDLDIEAVMFDFVPNRLFRDSCQVGFFDSPPESDQTNLTGLQPGRHVVIAYDAYAGPNFAPGIAAPIEVKADASVDVTVAVNDRCTLSGWAFDTNGLPLPQAIVVVTGRGPITDARVAKLDETVRATNGEGTYAFDCVRTDADGRFTIEGMPPGVTVRVVALHPRREPAFSEFATLAVRGTIRNLEARFAKKRER